MTVTPASSNNTLPDVGDCTETCRNCFNINLNLLVFNFSTLCIYNVNNTGTKQVRITKQTALKKKTESLHHV